jgi:hypothetical protein
LTHKVSTNIGQEPKRQQLPLHLQTGNFRAEAPKIQLIIQCQNVQLHPEKSAPVCNKQIRWAFCSSCHITLTIHHTTLHVFKLFLYQVFTSTCHHVQSTDGICQGTWVCIRNPELTVAGQVSTVANGTSSRHLMEPGSLQLLPSYICV